MGYIMKTSTEIATCAEHVGEEKAIELIAKAGFDAWDFSMFDMKKPPFIDKLLSKHPYPLTTKNYLAFARKLRQIGLDNGIHCNQSHAPFPSNSPKVRDYLLRAIECTAEAGGKICVIHPDNNKTPEKNAEMFMRLLPFAKDCGVKIATENMWNWNKEKNESSFAACSTSESFLKHLEAVNDDFLVACLDIGHAEMRGSGSGAVNMIKALGNKLQALHIHDNDKIHDSHAMPFTMNIDFDAIVNTLRDIDYQGYFTLEVDTYLKNYNAENIHIGVADMYKVAKRLADMFDNK